MMATILIADDQPTLRLVCRIMLEQNHFDVIEAADGREAIRLYCHVRPAGVLLDINMPVLDGLAALEQIRQVDPEARIAMRQETDAPGGSDPAPGAGPQHP